MFQNFPVFILILVWLCLPAFFLILETLFHNVLQESRDIAEEAAGRSFWLGLVNGIFLIALTALFFFLGEQNQTQIIVIPGLLFLSVIVIGAVFGLGSMILLIGEKLFPTLSPTRKLFYGSGVTILGCTTPILGWYGLLPYLLFVGFGAYVTRTYNRLRASREKKTAAP